MRFKKILKATTYFILSLILFIGIYVLSAITLSRISTDKEDDTKDEISIYILSNGVHTDIVMPIKSDEIDWSKDFKFENTESNDTLSKYIAIGWGDKGFYLETPTWADLKFSTACNAAFGLSTSAIHATFYKNMIVSDSCKRIGVSVKQYQRLINYIKASLQKDALEQIISIKTNSIYGKYDAFYEATGSYSLFYTCNTWANNALKSCGQKASFWTPFDTGIFYHYRD